jgi:predicted Zn-dependent protease
VINKAQAYKILKSALFHSRADMTEAVIENERLSLSRFAESKIHQSIDREQTTLYIRAVKDKKIGVIATGDISEMGIKKAVADCEDMFQYMVADEKFVSIPDRDPAPLKENFISPGTVQLGARERAEAIRTIAEIGDSSGLEASGAFRIERNHVAVLNSFGMRRYYEGNHGQLSLTLSGTEDNSGWAMAYSIDASAIDASSLALTAAEKAMASYQPISLPDGKYTVILEPAAVGQLLLMLSFMGFGGKTFYQHRSFMAGKMGEKITGDNFTCYEDPYDESFGIMPFDYEGVPRKRVPLIANGYARGVVYNSYYANLAETQSTGHALPPTNTYGPYPKALSVAGGKSSIEEMIKSTEYGILITHFWYLNFLNPMMTMVTGTTRDGTFLIENGEITSPVRNMRTNQSILEAFSNIEMISRDKIVYPQYGVLMKVPGMKINKFSLTTEEEDEDKC